MWPRGRVSLRLVTSSIVCVVAAGLGPGPPSIDFCFVFGNCLSIKALERHESREACEVCWADSSQAAPGISRDRFNRGQCSSLHIIARDPKAGTFKKTLQFPYWTKKLVCNASQKAIFFKPRRLMHN